MYGYLLTFVVIDVAHNMLADIRHVLHSYQRLDICKEFIERSKEH